MNSNGDAYTTAIRPARLADIVGQARVKERIAFEIQSALSLGEQIDHVFMYGPYGLGKTTVASAITAELGCGELRIIDGAELTRKGDLIVILRALKEGQILFVDEFHRVRRELEETFHPAMEDYRLNLRAGSIQLKPWTLIAATTREDLVRGPLRSRFGIDLRFDFYTTEELAAIILRAAKIEGIAIDDEAAFKLAGCARGTPRIAILQRLRRARAFAQANGYGAITLAVVEETLRKLGIDDHGLEEMDLRLLRGLVPQGIGEPYPVGRGALAAILRTNEDTLVERYEPYLSELGLVERTPHGLKATRKTYEYLKMELPIQWRPSRWK